MIKFQGEGDITKVNIRIYGDGVTKQINIDLSKPPFNLAFQGFFPKNVLVAHIAHGVPKTVVLQNSTLSVAFPTAPPPTDLSQPDIPASPFTSFTVEFVYGSDITT